MNVRSVSVERLSEVVSGFSNCTIAVIGDLILDEFVWGNVERISPEAPVPVVEVTRESEHLGGAANVALNLTGLGAKVDLVGVVGKDLAAERLSERLVSCGMSIDSVVRDSERRTTIKTRIVAHHQQVCRTDRETKKNLPPTIREKVIDCAREAIAKADAVILSDYGKGVLSDEISALLIEYCREKSKFVAVDPKVNDFSHYGQASIITPNKWEAELASGVSISDDASLEQAGKKILRITSAHDVLITRGHEGMSLISAEGRLDIPTVAREVFDVTGAGDTVIATLALGVAAGATVHEAAVLANHAAGVVVGKLGTASASINELFYSLSGSRGVKP
jgi:D-beta-D-heptose 7-phosphate kinase/D-beta-D-heptose 1-phosphate adenosyltransferase